MARIYGTITKSANRIDLWEIWVIYIYIYINTGNITHVLYSFQSSKMYVRGGLNWGCGIQQHIALWRRFQQVTSMLCPLGCKKWALAEELCVRDAGTHSVQLHWATGLDCPGSAGAEAGHYCLPGTPSETHRTNSLKLNRPTKYSSLYEFT